MLLSYLGDHRLAVNQERLRLEAERGVNDGREALGPVIAATCEAADPRAVPAHHQPMAVVLDLVHPERAGGRRWQVAVPTVYPVSSD